jgi:hypothetical protein
LLEQVELDKKSRALLVEFQREHEQKTTPDSASEAGE